MKYSLKNKVILITGSSIGIGYETALQCAKEGAKVVITYYKDKDEAHRGAKECTKLGAADVMVVRLNVKDSQSIQACVENVVKKFNEIHVLVNNAGVVYWKPFREQTFEEIENLIRTNVEGLMKMTLEALPHTKDAIINVSSGAGKSPYAGLAAYCGTKYAVRGFTQSLAKELKDIRLYSVNPGLTATRMTDYEGASPKKVARVLVSAIKGKYVVKSGGDVDVWKHIG